jgi:hypothetical protein
VTSDCVRVFAPLAGDMVRHFGGGVFRRDNNRCNEARSPGGAAVHTCRLQQPRRWRRTQQQRLRRGAVRKVVQASAPSREPEGTAMQSRPPQEGGHGLVTPHLG